MNEFFNALTLERPVYWLLLESQGRKGFPHETLELWDTDELKDNGYGVFFCPNELGDQKNDKGNLRHEANVIRFTSVFVDLDSGTPAEQQMRLRSFILPPTAVVKTGRGYHAYWRLKDGAVEPRDWQAVQKAMAQMLQGDPACVDPARLMRAPSTWHVKAEPKYVELVHLNASWAYSLSEFPKQSTAEKKVFYLPPDADRRKRIQRPPRAPTPCHIAEGVRHATLLKEAGRYLRGVAPSEVADRIDTIKSWYAQSSRPLKKEWEREVEDVTDWILKKELGSL